MRFVDWLSQDLDDLLGFFEISTAQQVNDDLVTPQYALSECLWLLLDVEYSYGRAWNWDCVFIFLNKCSHEFVRFSCLVDDKVIVTHLFKDAMSNETVDSTDDDTLVFVRIRVLLHLCDFCISCVVIETRFSSIDFRFINS